MSFDEYLRELIYPLRSLSILLVALLLFVIIGFVIAVSYFNPWVAGALLLLFSLGVLPGIMRYLMQIAEWRARGENVDPPTAEMFGIFGSFWQLSPLFLIIAGSVALHWIDQRVGGAGAALAAIAFATIFPAMIGVLVITHSFTQCLNPQALVRLISSTGDAYFFAVASAFAVLQVPAWLVNESTFLAIVAGIYLIFAFYGVSGAMLKQEGLVDDVELPDPVEPDAEKQIANLEKERTSVLNHAYGFASRGNRDGALIHIGNWLSKDPDPQAAWSWFFDQMLRWEQQDHALFFAQAYISDLLAHGDDVMAVKVILRGRLVSERFRPASKDLPQAIEAALACGNEELAGVLKRL